MQYKYLLYYRKSESGSFRCTAVIAAGLVISVPYRFDIFSGYALTVVCDLAVYYVTFICDIYFYQAIVA